MRFRALIGLFALATACSERPASYLEPECGLACLNEDDVRLNSLDVLVKAPEIWKFFDEVGQQLPRRCSDDGGVHENGLTPLWRRTIVGFWPEYQAGSPNWEIQGRAALAVHPTGGVAVSIDHALWLLDGETGIPNHIVKASLDPFDSTALRVIGAPVVAFTPDGDHVWVDSTGPTLLNLKRFDRRFGFQVEYSWFRAHQTPFVVGWTSPSQSVGRDGTLFWSSGRISHALEMSGTVRWERPGIGGFVTVDENDDSWWGQPAISLRAADGTVGWQPDAPPGFDAQRTRLLNVEGSPLGDFIPVQHFAPATGASTVALHRRDGSLVGTIPMDYADEGATLGNKVFLTRNSELSAWSVGTRQRLWSTTFGQQINGGPVLSSTTGSAWVVTEDCRVSEVDSNGNVVRWHEMAGRPTDQIAKLSNGILYVLSMTQSEVPEGEEWLPGDVTKVDGGSTVATEYGCYLGISDYCGLGLKPGPVFFLYAFRVE